MNKVTVKKDELLEVLRENRSKHRAIVEEAWEGYIEHTKTMLAEQVALARKGVRRNYSIQITMPVDHTREYDLAIRMLEMEIEPNVEIDAHQFQQYVMDEWEWARQFTASNMTYSKTLRGE